MLTQAQIDRQNQKNIEAAMVAVGKFSGNTTNKDKQIASDMLHTTYKTGKIVLPSSYAKMLLSKGVADAGGIALMSWAVNHANRVIPQQPVKKVVGKESVKLGSWYGTRENVNGNLGTMYPVQLQWAPFPFGTGTGGREGNLGTSILTEKDIHYDINGDPYVFENDGKTAIPLLVDPTTHKIMDPDGGLTDVTYQKSTSDGSGSGTGSGSNINWSAIETQAMSKGIDLLSVLGKDYGEEKINEMKMRADLEIKKMIAAETGKPLDQIYAEDAANWAAAHPAQVGKATQTAALSIGMSDAKIAALIAAATKTDNTGLYIGLGVGGLLLVGLLVVAMNKPATQIQYRERDRDRDYDRYAGRDTSM